MFSIHVKQERRQDHKQCGKWYLVHRDEDGSYYWGLEGWNNDYEIADFFATETEANAKRDELHDAERDLFGDQSDAKIN